MPVQVLGRTADESARSITAAFAAGQDAIAKSQAALLTARELDIASKKAKTEQEKQVLERQKFVFTEATKLKEARDSGKLTDEGLARGFKQLADISGNPQEFFKDVAESGERLENNLKALAPQGQKVQAEADKQKQLTLESQGRVKTQEALRNRFFPGGVGGGNQNQPITIDGQTGVPPDGGLPPEAAGVGAGTTASRAGAVGGGDLAPSSVNISPRGEISAGFNVVGEEGRKTGEREKAKIQVDLGQTKFQFGGYKAAYEDALQELGDVPESALGAFIKGGTASLFSNIGTLPAIQSFTKIKETSSLLLASFYNRGRPSDPDRIAVQKSMMDITYPVATNRRLMAFHDRNLSLGGEGSDAVTATQLDAFTKEVIDPGKEAMKRGLDRGLTPSEVNELLEEWYADRGL